MRQNNNLNSNANIKPDSEASLKSGIRKITPAEEKIMEIFWDRGGMFVKELLSFFPQPAPHFNTLSTNVRNLEAKGFLGHVSYGNSYKYFAIITRDEYGYRLLGEVVDKYYNGSPYDLVASLIGRELISAQELRRLAL